MEPGGQCFNGAAEIRQKDVAGQNTSQGNWPDLGGEKTITESSECVPSPKKMKVECFAKTDEMISSNCGTRVAQQASPSEASKTECQTTPCPKTPSPQKCSPGIGQTSSSSFNVSFGRLPSPQVTRRSLRRCSLKQGTSRRKSLPPLQADITELSKAISLDLPEADRMIELLLSSFQYSAEKLEYSLRQTEGFNPETFEQKVNLISEELRHCVKRLKLDGTLQKCLEDPRGGSSDPALDKSIAVLKENIARFSAEDQAWDQLLLSYQKRAEEISRQLQEYKLKQVSEEPFSYLGTSQAHVLQAKPDYQKILDCQEKVFDCMELVLDEIHQVVKICQVYTEDITRYLQKLSVQLASRTFQRLENSPARKLLRLPQTKPSLPQPPEG